MGERKEGRKGRGTHIQWKHAHTHTLAQTGNAVDSGTAEKRGEHTSGIKCSPLSAHLQKSHTCTPPAHKHTHTRTHTHTQHTHTHLSTRCGSCRRWSLLLSPMARSVWYFTRWRIYTQHTATSHTALHGTSYIRTLTALL